MVAAVLEVYRHEGLAEPGLTGAWLCRWEHDAVAPDPDYAHALARVHQVSPRRLGLKLSGTVADGGYGHPTQPSEPKVRNVCRVWGQLGLVTGRPPRRVGSAST